MLLASVSGVGSDNVLSSEPEDKVLELLEDVEDLLERLDDASVHVERPVVMGEDHGEGDGPEEVDGPVAARSSSVASLLHVVEDGKLGHQVAQSESLRRGSATVGSRHKRN